MFTGYITSDTKLARLANYLISVDPQELCNIVQLNGKTLDLSKIEERFSSLGLNNDLSFVPNDSNLWKVVWDMIF